jgi:hypothetical protein
VSGLDPVFDLWGALVDHRHCGQPSTPLDAEKAPSTTTPASWTRQANRRVIDRLIDRLGAQPRDGCPAKKILSWCATCSGLQPLSNSLVAKSRSTSSPAIRRFRGF